ncbi:CHASE2 domain-containing protein [Beggiatoa leptomitoformis]|uniref:CHASE2 domain-containing protein n=1 Tax=Beggiatoa leptomitoformis TaxID=288004 RepID=A0A2N9YE09_9GAMM|nr:CHASE2 domain-containing protein [Beggiatoa leptomitoformis]ALG69532.2 CHASE2 domain-containing protein [Beggiatoa leptomitoformis]AUI68728.1 CHASE2 domain-containing protein [Beggiatoa leptomitoformis]
MSRIFSTLKRHALRTLLSFCILAFFIAHTTGASRWHFIDDLELMTYDTRLRMTMTGTHNNDIVIVDIDEKSLSQIGRWPWKRNVVAKLMNQLFDTYKINLLGLDIVFAEPDESSGLHIMEQLAETQFKDQPTFKTTLDSLKPNLDYDQLFADSLNFRRIILGYSFDYRGNTHAGVLPTPVFNKAATEKAQQEYGVGLIEANGYVANLPIFQDNVVSAGHFNVIPDGDGIVRRVPMLNAYNGELYESLSLAMARVILSEPFVEFGTVEASGYHSVEYLRLGSLKIPVDNYLRALVPYQGEPGLFTYVSAVDVLNGNIAPDILKNKIVLLGTTAQGLLDLRPTPVAGVYPGVEIHATLLSGLLGERIMQNPVYATAMEIMLLLSIGVVMIIILPIFSPLLAMGGTIIVILFMFWLNVRIWEELRLIFPLASTSLLMLSLFLFNMSYGYLVETRRKKQLANRFGEYVPKELVDEMSKDPSLNLSMESENREMTVLFSDVRGFTTISEGLSPKELSTLMNAYLSPMTEIIHEYRGTIDKYMGDAIMAFWGAPLHDAQHATHAIEAGLKMLKRLDEIQASFQARGWPPIKIGVGLSTGIMSVGNMGSSFRMAYTVLGDAVNLGSRLEGITKQYGVSFVVSENTCKAAPDYLYRELDYVRVKGKDKPVGIFEPLCLRSEALQQVLLELALYEQALKQYRQQQWTLAQQAFTRLYEQYPERKLYKVYLERIDYFQQNPPTEAWDGVYTFTTK